MASLWITSSVEDFLPYYRALESLADEWGWLVKWREYRNIGDPTEVQIAV